MRHTRRSAAKNLRDEASTGIENRASAAAATTQPMRNKRTLDSTDTTDPHTLLAQAQATIVNPPSKRARKGGDIAHSETQVQMNQSDRERGQERGRREQLAAIDNNKGKRNAQQSSSSFSFYLTPNGSSSHVPGQFDTDSDKGDVSDIENEEDWFGSPQDVQPGEKAASKVSQAMNDERALWQDPAHPPAPSSSPLDSGVTTELDNGQGNGSGSTNATIMTRTQPTWPVETDLVYAAGTNRVKLSIQRPLLQAIFHDTFENVRCALLFDHAFPDAVNIPRMIRGAIVAAAEAHKFVDGHHNTTASCIHQRLLSDDEYLTKMIRLPRARIPIFRGEVKDRCAQIVQSTFLSIPSPGTIIDTVNKELSNYIYTCPTITSFGVKGLPMRSKLYRNVRIITVIRNLFFTGGTLAYAHRYDHKFPRFRGNDGVVVREVPAAMLALVATALYAAIHEWRAGYHQATEFSTDAYIDAYNGHIGTLQRIEVERPGAFHTMMAHVYSLASETDGRPPSLPIADINIDELDG